MSADEENPLKGLKKDIRRNRVTIDINVNFDPSYIEILEVGISASEGRYGISVGILLE